MKEHTFNRRLNQFVTELNNHKHKDELPYIMKQQFIEDCVKVDTK